MNERKQPTTERDPGAERRDESREQRDRAAAPPIEREHETYAGVLEEDEKREREGH